MLLINTVIHLFSSLLVFSLGAAVGSFLNVVIYRIPAGISLLYPPSRCPVCLTRLRPYDNIPILGWMLLRGQCRYCHTSISYRYPLIETLTALLFLWVFLLLGWQWQTLSYWLFLSWLLALGMIDLDTLTLPHPLTKWGLITGVVLQTVMPGLTGGWQTALLGFTESVVAAVIGIWLFDLVRWGGAIAMKQDVMGGGDGKLAALIGAWLGWKLLLFTFFLGSTLGAIVGMGGIALRLIHRRQPIPFGPFLAVAAMVAALFGDALINSYLDWLFSGMVQGIILAALPMVGP